MKSSSDSQFESILSENRLHTLFQPIVNFKDGKTAGFEALSRGPDHTAYFSPLFLLEEAAQSGKTRDLDRLFRKNALERAREQQIAEPLFLNIEPDSIVEFGRDETEFRSDRRLVLEITERAVHSRRKDLPEAQLRHMRSVGYRLAFDDAGTGHSSYDRMIQIKPEFIKIDAGLIQGIHRDRYRQSLIQSFVLFSRLTGSLLIAEGIETLSDLETLVRLGVQAGQGYLLGRPERYAVGPRQNIIRQVRQMSKLC
ncbi:MAG TPA: EAL domain-containing protein [Clostridia bacterium]|nr:EAL domain-containing protein [Clostridia bacterium]